MAEKAFGPFSLAYDIDRIPNKGLALGAWVWNLKDSAAPFRAAELFIGGKS